MRTALGQVLDYARFVDHRSKAVLLPVRPPSELIDLLAAHDVVCIWERDAGDFERSDS
ncbi:MAG: hypothetical protein ACXVXI_03655 [Mycobacteriaceae bacterium]